MSLKERCEAELIIGMNSFQYPQYTETFAWGFYNFVANMGGTLGIWLGIDIILTIECFLTLKEWLFIVVELYKQQKSPIAMEHLPQNRVVIEPDIEMQSV